jgi:hypothetical protein
LFPSHPKEKTLEPFRNKLIQNHPSNDRIPFLNTLHFKLYTAKPSHPSK